MNKNIRFPCKRIHVFKRTCCIDSNMLFLINFYCVDILIEKKCDFLINIYVKKIDFKINIKSIFLIKNIDFKSVF